MAVNYVGREVSYEGKKLFHLLGKLKNFGVGRMVYRHTFNARYPEPSYFVITRAEPDMTKLKEGLGKAWGYKVFRGEKLGVTGIEACFKADWRLVPRNEEDKFTSLTTSTEKSRNVIESELRMPPLLENLVKQSREKAGEDVNLPIMLSRTIRHGPANRAVMDSEQRFFEENT